MSIATVPKTVGSPQSNQSQQKVLQARENKNMSSNAGAFQKDGANQADTSGMSKTIKTAGQ